jgi:uncharacterized protein (TIGR00369 family)
MFRTAPVNLFFSGIQLLWEQDRAIIEINASEHYFHAGGSLHGAVYMKLLDDAAYFTAALQQHTYFLLTADFQIKFLRPVTGGSIYAKGQLLKQEGKYIYASSELFSNDGKLVASGTGRFAPGKQLWTEIAAYRAGLSN